MSDKTEKNTFGGKGKYRKLTLLQYVIYLGVTPCALAALALLVFIIVKGPGKTQPPTTPADTVTDTIY